jgi:hypothetical protein
VPVYLKNKIQYLSDRHPYSLQNVVSEKLQKGWFMMLKVEDTMGKKKMIKIYVLDIPKYSFIILYSDN